MKENKIIELKKDILNGKAEFLDIICEIMDKNKILYSDNYGDLSKEEIKAIEYLEPFMHLLYSFSA